MVSLELQHVSVWLDELAPERGAFAHALEWAAHLRLSLYGITSTLGTWGGRLAGHRKLLESGTLDGAPGVVPSVKVAACASACARQGVSWNLSPGDGPLAGGIDPLLRPVELCAFGDALPRPWKDLLLRQSLRSPDSAVLVCAKSWQPVSRVLILNEEREPGNNFLDISAEICQAFGVAPVVLSVARFEREARLRQRFAEERFAARGQDAAFDFIAGCDARSAVAWVARWRRCSHVFVERAAAPPWWRWLRGDTLQQLFGLSDSLTFLALPGAGRPRPSLSENRASSAETDQKNAANRPNEGYNDT
jgi:hypothetical protein